MPDTRHPIPDTRKSMAHKALQPWIIYSVLAAFCWGVWGVLAKLISSDVTPYTNHFLFTVGMMATLPFVIKSLKRKDANRKGIIWGLVAGALAVTGNIAVYKAFASGGMAAIVIPVTNLYPLITIVVALLVFKEKLHWIQAIGIFLSIPAIVMLSGQTMLFENPSLFLKNFTPEAWLLFSFLALFFWGIFSAAQKVTTNHVNAEWSYVSFIISSVLITVAFVFLGLINLRLPAKMITIGAVAGMLNGLGVLASFAAYGAEGKASQVTTIAGALQPVFTIVLAILFLHESITIIEVLGILLAIAGALTLSYERKKTDGLLRTA